jgi:ankyrin repeat protein
MAKANRDLLKQRLLYNFSFEREKFENPTVDTMFDLVRRGKITELAELLHGRDPKELKALMGVRDMHGRTLLMNACYLNYKNIVLFLLYKGADPSVVDYNNISLMHILMDQGNLESLIMVLNYIYFDFRETIDIELKRIQKELNVKRTDVRQGILVSPDKHLPKVKRTFQEFENLICSLYSNYLTRLLNIYDRMLYKSIDEFGRNPIHYGAMGLQFNTVRCVNAVFEFGNPPDYNAFYQTFTEVMNLEINKENISDPKRTKNIMEVVENFLLPDWKKKTDNDFIRSKLALQKDIVNTQDAQGYTPLHLASFYGQYELVNKFLLLGANTKLRDSVHHKEPIELSRNPCIMKAIRDINDSVLDNDMDKFDFLLNSGFSIEDKKSIKIRRPVHHSVVNADAELNKQQDTGKEELFLKTVVRCGADIDSTDSDGWTALHYACKLGHPEPVITLLNNGASHQIFSNHGYYPIHVAAIENHIAIIDILVKRGADVNVGLILTI